MLLDKKKEGQMSLFCLDKNFQLTPRLAKYLTGRKGEPYKYLIDKHAIEWIVLATLDNGRTMALAQAETDGKVRKEIWSCEYKNYEVMWECIDDTIPEKFLKRIN